MALNISEYRELAQDRDGTTIPAPKEPSAARQKVTVGSQSSQFTPGTYFVRLHAEEDVRIAFGVDPAADTNSSFRMVSGQTEFIGVVPGHKLDTAAG